MQRLSFALLEKREGVRHCVTLRDPSRPLDFSLALHTGQAAEAIRANRQALEEYFGREAHFVSVLQVHGDTVHRVEKPVSHGWEEAAAIRADALLTSVPGVVLTILTADCVPVLLYDPVRKVIGAAHAGWKGSRLGIVTGTLKRMQDDYGSRPGDIRAVIGPAIGGCCYEVDPELAEHFLGIDGAVLPGKSGKPHLDLKRVNRHQLIEAGVSPEHIETSSVCTACDHARFFSYRKEGGCDGRFMSCIMLDDSR